MPGRTTKLLKLAIPLLVLLCGVVARAEVHLPAIIGDNMVLQQDTKVRIWGTANANERITVTFNSRSANAVADSQGRWQVWLGPFKAGGPFELTVKGDKTITIK